jgi:hypothetical protein
MRTLLIKLALLVLLFIPITAQAQEPIRLTSVNIDIWPEYDQEAVLIIERVTLASDTVLPATLNLRIPAAGQLNAVATVDAAGRLVNAPYEIVVRGGWSVLSITTNSLNTQVEYYQALVKDGINRHILYEWPGDSAVDVLEANFLTPPASENLKIDPPSISNAPGQGGLINYLIRAENLPEGQSFNITIDYQRKTDELSISSLPIQPVTEPGVNTPGRVSMPVLLPWILAGVGGVLVVGGVIGFIVWKRGNTTSSPVKGSAVLRPQTITEKVYCHECGNRAQPGDIFCRTCGTRLKQVKD